MKICRWINFLSRQQEIRGETSDIIRLEARKTLSCILKTMNFKGICWNVFQNMSWQVVDFAFIKSMVFEKNALKWGYSSAGRESKKQSLNIVFSWSGEVLLMSKGSFQRLRRIYKTSDRSDRREQEALEWSARRERKFLWGYSSAGRALEWHSRGQEFDPP